MIRTWIVLLALALPTATAQAVPPQAAAERWVDAFLELHDARDEAGLRAFLRDGVDPRTLGLFGGPENAARELATLYSGLGPLERVATTAGDGTTAYLRGTLTGGWVALRLVMDPDDPDRALWLGIALHERPPDAPDSPVVPEGEAPAAIDAYLAALAEHDLFSGVVAIAKHGETRYAGAFGRANRAGDPVELDTRFALGSTSKTFTALAVLQLVDAGAIALDDPVRRHLPDPPAGRLEGVTVRHLLTHGSGLGTFDLAAIRPLRTVEEMLALPLDPPAFAPGRGFRYSNAGYLLLGGIVEAASGRDFYAYLDEHVFEPAGMTRTGGVELAGEPPGVATGFLPLAADGTRPDALDRRVRRGSPAADLVATAPDLLRYGEALLDGRLLDDPLRTEAMTPQRLVHRDAEGTLAYGYGLWIETRDGTTSVGHGGGSPGASSAFHLYPEEGWTIVVLSNYELVADVVSRRLREMLGLRPRAPRDGAGTPAPRGTAGPAADAGDGRGPTGAAPPGRGPGRRRVVGSSAPRSRILHALHAPPR